MKRYSEYKDSGVEWIGEVPSHWNISKLKYIVNTTKGFAFKSELFESEGIPVVKASDIKNKTIVCINNYINENIANKYTNVKLLEGDIIMSTVGSTPDVKNSAVGQLAYIPNNIEGSLLNQNTVILRVDQSNLMDNRYLFYALCSSVFRSYLDLYAHGTANQASLSLADILNYDISIPSKLEQKEITKYLDEKTSQIENLISKKEELIETLKASRTKLISETVTKGLDKNVPMKDSGVEWIGDIPSHYEIKKLKNLCTHIGRGKSPEYEENTGAYTVNQACLYWNYFKSESIKSVSNKFYNSLNINQKINKGDILINSTGGGNLGKSAFFDKTGTLGRVHFYEGDEKYAYDSHVTMVRLKESFNKKYFYYMFCTKNVHSYIDLFCVNGSTKQIELSKTGLESIVIPVPSKKEQDEISKYLDIKTEQIDILVIKIEEQIELLKKAKQKLITEVVTGKIDVTNL
ncbi:restriction endonuclease S subunit [[Clostridium] sordellii]|uniref:restriction endonuclease subunit S n=1 Tax=Paraclostridium sordellii TaxID=1505 RepID=UPI0005DECE11|nr:restriction endonuclease subunit S [Paeniclostridium sordellii]CEP90224.1 restriction endonuclease S subunit [[Clostridium] sordellii] [Paeniclostridium sordellii]